MNRLTQRREPAPGLGFSLPVRPRGREVCCSFTFFASSSPIFNPAFCREPRIQRMTRRGRRTRTCNPLNIRLFFPTGFSTTERDFRQSFSTNGSGRMNPERRPTHGTISADMSSVLCIQLATKRNNMKQEEFTRKFVLVRLLTTLGLFFSAAWPSKSDTITNGDLCGTWTPAGNPYTVTDISTVPSGQTLTIEPGVVVWIGSNVTINVNGLIQAVGNSNSGSHITFGPINNVGTKKWNTINVNSSAGTHQFKFCDFKYANVALSLGGPTTNCDIMYCTFQNVGDGVDMIASACSPNMASRIMNCIFTNCASRAIYGQAYGGAGMWFECYQTLNVVVKNCIFNGNGNGCVFSIWGGRWCYPQGCLTGYGYANLQIVGNIFYNTTGAALYTDAGSYAGSSSAIVINNTIVNAGYGIRVQDPWDAKVQSCILAGCTNAMVAVGSLSRHVEYNDFHGCATNFVGYPGPYGDISYGLTNRNGTPCDPLFNITNNPQFVALDDFHLAADSPCIDAGTPDWAYTDMCFPPSQGSDFPDMGAYGGPDACNWLDEVPLLPTTLVITRADQMMTLNWGAIPRSEYQVQFATNLLTVGTNWLICTDGWVLAVDKPTSWIVTTNLSPMFLRVQSLGRTFGN